MSTDAALSTRLARHIAALRYEDLPAATVVSTKRALLDGLGVAIAASGISDDVRPFVELARAQGGAPQASILGSWERVNASSAALANGAMAHALDFEDAFDAAPTHPNASLIPAALAIAQSQPGISGQDFILAMAVGCDVSCRMALSVGDALERSPWYPPTIVSALGAVTATAKLMNLGEAQIKDALSLLLCQLGVAGEIKHSQDTVLRAVREAFPAQTAVTAASLAARGVRGFEAPLEGRGGFFKLFANGMFDETKLCADLGKRFYIDELSFKPWPCCRGTHPYIEAAQQLRAQHELDWRQIKSIRARIGPVQRMLSEPIERKRAPSTAIDAKFSIPFSVASAFIDTEVTLDSFATSKLNDANVLGLAQKVDFDFREHGMTATNGALEVELADGERFTAEIAQALGHPSRPLDDARLKAKFIDCVKRAAKPMNDHESDGLAARIMTLDSAPSLNRDLFARHPREGGDPS
jgi:2-methylcitrate dehydratase PrpD